MSFFTDITVVIRKLQAMSEGGNVEEDFYGGKVAILIENTMTKMVNLELGTSFIINLFYHFGGVFW